MRLAQQWTTKSATAAFTPHQSKYFLWISFATTLLLASQANVVLAQAPLATPAAVAPAAATAPAADAPAPTTEELTKELREMQQRMKTLEAQMEQNKRPPSKAAARPVPALGKTAPAAMGAAASAPVQAAGGGVAKAPLQALSTGGMPAPTQTSGVQVSGRQDAGIVTAPPASIAGLPQLPPPASAAPGSTAIVGLADLPPAAGATFGGYGEILFGMQRNPDAGGQRQFGFDARRVVLAPTYALTNNIIFNAEIEWEHGGFAADADDKLAGSIDVEQLFVDFKFTSWFNWRAPGIDLVPIGYINEHHEPNQFYSVRRPEIYLGIIPSTFRVPGSRLYGSLGHGFSYAVQVSHSVEDFGDHFDKRTSANAVAAGGYEGGINGREALGLSRPPVGDFRQLSNTLAYAGRLEYQPPWWPGFAASISNYYTPNTTPRGAYADNGLILGKSSLNLFDVEFRYRLPATGLELRGEFARVDIGNPENLRANNDGDATNNVGKTMHAISGEIAYHVPLGTIIGSQWEAVPFYRYTFQRLQSGGYSGTDDNLPTGAGETRYHTAGIAVMPSPKVSLKATYQNVRSKDPAVPNSDSVLGSVGYTF